MDFVTGALEGLNERAAKTNERSSVASDQEDARHILVYPVSAQVRVL